MGKSASRVHAARDACESEHRVTLGVVHAQGDRDEVIPAIATEAAEHGGTHYVIESAADETEIVTHGAAMRVGATTLVGVQSHEEVTRKMWATVYRCDRER